ncbi:MAG: 3-dehydroquinate synthase [Kiloniellales bacterium]
MTEVETVHVDLGARGYDIHVGVGVLGMADQYLSPVLRRRRVVTVTDETVAELQLPALDRALENGEIEHHAVVLPPGEASKSFARLEWLIERLLDARIERSTTLLALGGGMIGDLAGFAASVVLRGIDYLQLPTTLLAQVDSSVGGKTGINTRHGKNLVGSFHQPRLVLADIGALDTLGRREFLAGYAEVVKYGLIGDAKFFAWLEAHGADLIDGDPDLRRHAVVTACGTKAGVVAADEREAGPRALLNFGHTFGHALEAETGFGDELLHGEAVAIGMVTAFALSARLGLCPAADAARVRRHLAAVGLPTDLAHLSGRVWDAGRLFEHMAQDKKVRDGKLRFVLSRGIGQAFVCDAVAPDQLIGVLEEAIAA